MPDSTRIYRCEGQVPFGVWGYKFVLDLLPDADPPPTLARIEIYSRDINEFTPGQHYSLTLTEQPHA